MSIEETSLPDDLAACQALIEMQLAIIARLQTQLDQLQGTAGQQTETIESQQQLIDKLRHGLDLFKRYIIGRRRERFVDDPRQGKLFEIDEELTGPAELADQQDDPAESSPKHRRGGHGRRPLPDFLPREEVIHELNEGERKCPCCGTLRIKVSEEISEQLEFQPASLFVVRHVRYIYTCQEDACEANMTTAPKPPQPIEKGLPGPGLLSFVITSKLADHLPLNRQEDILTRNGIHIHRSTLAGWMSASADLVAPLYELMVQQTLASKVLGTDDTKAPCPSRDSRLAVCRAPAATSMPDPLTAKTHPAFTGRIRWEHTIDDEDEFERLFDYIHYNPVNHGYVSCPHLWTASSFDRWVKRDVYDARWGCRCNGRDPGKFDFSDIQDKTGE